VLCITRMRSGAGEVQSDRCYSSPTIEMDPLSVICACASAQRVMCVSHLPGRDPVRAQQRATRAEKPGSPAGEFDRSCSCSARIYLSCLNLATTSSLIVKFFLGRTIIRIGGSSHEAVASAVVAKVQKRRLVWQFIQRDDALERIRLLR